jgi:hypothetical protein
MLSLTKKRIVNDEMKYSGVTDIEPFDKNCLKRFCLSQIYKRPVKFSSD